MFNRVLILSVIATILLSCPTPVNSVSGDNDGPEITLPTELTTAQINTVTSAISSATAGGTILVPNGTWPDADITISANGSSESPITLKAENEGEAYFTGDSYIEIRGDYVVIEGFVFTGASSQKKTIYIDDLADNAKVTKNDFNARDYNGSSKHHAIYSEGTNTEISYNAFRNFPATADGEWVRVYRNNTDRVDNAHIHHNYFYNRDFTGSNGGEMIQIGLWQTQETDSNTIVEYNWFERCNGETEVISVKASGNTIRYNTFLDNDGTLTLRHGDRNLVFGNVFRFTEHQSASGGIRVYGSDHVIANNYIEKLGNSSSQIRGGISLHSGDTTDYDNTTRPAENCFVGFNTLVDNNRSLIFGSDKPLDPTNNTVVYNVAVPASGYDVIARYATDQSTWSFEGNFFYGSLGYSPTPGGIDTSSNPNLAKSDTIYRPTSGSPLISANTATDYTAYLTEDFDRASRGSLPWDAGADEYGVGGTTGAPGSASETGPDWIWD